VLRPVAAAAADGQDAASGGVEWDEVAEGVAEPEGVLGRRLTGGKGAGKDVYIRTTPLLLSLPTPDFSMPYNVIILTSTVMALAFGSVFNLLVRRFVAREEAPASGLLAKVLSAVRRWKDAKGMGKGKGKVE
jgi:hypothetical protein